MTDMKKTQKAKLPKVLNNNQEPHRISQCHMRQAQKFPAIILIYPLLLSYVEILWI